MKPSLRLLKVLTAPQGRGSNPSIRPSAEDPQAESMTRWRVMPWDVDLFGHMNNSRYALLMDFARVDFLRRAGLLPTAWHERWVIPVSSMTLDFHRALRPFDKFEVVTQLMSWDDRWLFMRQFFRTREEPTRMVATGYVKTIIRAPSGGVSPAHVARLVTGREVARPVLSDELWARFNVRPATVVDMAPQRPLDIPVVSIDSRQRGVG